MISSLAEAAELLDDADRPALGIQFDSWHLWNTPSSSTRSGATRTGSSACGIADWGGGTRSWCDRVLPGDGVARLPEILGALDRAGWDGYYDLEIFSDNGTFGNAWPDSLWDVPLPELVRRGQDSFERVWDARNRTTLDQVSPGAV